jgi:TRAP-type C4-dicarboxylate transport system substrate-binding protein
MMARALAVLLVAASTAQAAPRWIIRMTAIAPEGTSWSREVRAFSREIETETHGELLIKWYLGGITGNEIEMLDRVRRGQLDGIGSAGPVCNALAPSARVFGIVGLFQSRDEMSWVQQRLRPALEQEFRKSGFLLLSMTGLGPHVILSREPVRTVDDMKRQRFFDWELDEVGLLQSREMGLQVVPAPLEQAGRAFDAHQIDGFISIPTATLGYQWYTRAHYMLDLRVGFVSACLVMTTRAFDRLPPEYQRLIQAASAKLAARIDETGRATDDQLLGGVFQKQGVVPQQVTDAVRSQFLAIARAARERLGPRLVPLELMQQVLAMLADYRAEHH